MATKTKKKPEAKAKETTSKKPAVGSPEYMAKIRAKRGKGGKRKSSGKRELKKSLKELTKMVSKQGKMLEKLTGKKPAKKKK